MSRKTKDVNIEERENLEKTKTKTKIKETVEGGRVRYKNGIMVQEIAKVKMAKGQVYFFLHLRPCLADSKPREVTKGSESRTSDQRVMENVSLTLLRTEAAREFKPATL